TWDAGLGFGVATEVDVQEVFASLNKTRNIIIAFTIVSLITLLVLAYTTMRSTRKNFIALKQARSNEIRFRALAQTAQDAIITIGPNGLVMQWNQGAENMLGYEVKDVIGHSIDFIIPERYRVAHNQGLKRVLKTGNRQAVTSAIEISALRKDGTEFPIELTISHWFFDDEVYVTCFIRDNSERHKVDVELRKLSQTVEQSPHMIFITDPHGVIEYANAIFYKVSGYASQEVIGQNPRFLKSGSTTASEYKNLWKTIKSGEVWESEIEDKCKDGSLFWAHLTIAPIFSENNEITHFCAVQEDITVHKEAENEMHRAKEQTVVANKAKSQIMANMSHELRTPLNAIIGFSSSIKEGIFGPLGNHKYQDYINDIHISGNHLLDLINDILDVSAIEAGSFKLHEYPFDLNEVIETSLRSISPRAKSGEMSLLFGDRLNNLVLMGDERRCKQVFLNLLSNAVKFTPKGGDVTIHSQLSEKGDVVMVIKDTGCGMDTHELQTALSKFGQVESGLNRTHEGTGLGLSLAKGLVEMHGGTLHFKSAKGQGTTVTVTFPKDRIVPLD
ncbi:MAG: PAS domain S-box protein, partial [Magnetovibrio sp.]|nr:PAS domain S-box protein [Magnetovibrio sp.]